MFSGLGIGGSSQPAEIKPSADAGGYTGPSFDTNPSQTNTLQSFN